ncbi:MAG: DMT family transporter [Bacillati bacterium ANGP1]|uniref:DMT family transporter n=1 Tax=Candidatus Segetimicrobium genomatis TaxID=2569760 RepID=A0A537JA44_9BACT|nr:MAG: DMT family transporter [Terrabacteria group bacterium ANGP1]
MIQMRLREWGAFWLLGAIWGSSFLWIKIAVAEIGPVTLAAYRLLFGLLGLLPLAWMTGQAIPRDRSLLVRFLGLAVLNTALPFALISWGEIRIASGLAAILNGSTPLFTLIIAHFWLRDEKITPRRAAGLALGFVGVVVLMSRDLRAPAALESTWGQAAVLAASCSYAVAATFARAALRGQPVVVQATASVLMADAVLWLAVPVAEWPPRLPHLPGTWLALGWLGLLGSCVAYLLYYYLINAWGATRATIVTYVFPIFGLFLGVAALREPLTAQLIAGTLLIVTGIATATRVSTART